MADKLTNRNLTVGKKICPKCGNGVHEYGGGYSCNGPYCDWIGFDVEFWHKDVDFKEDGDQWCCVRSNFVNLQESPAGFGWCPGAAYRDLLLEEAKNMTVGDAVSVLGNDDNLVASPEDADNENWTHVQITVQQANQIAALIREQQAQLAVMREALGNQMGVIAELTSMRDEYGNEEYAAGQIKAIQTLLDSTTTGADLLCKSCYYHCNCNREEGVNGKGCMDFAAIEGSPVADCLTAAQKVAEAAEIHGPLGGITCQSYTPEKVGKGECLQCSYLAICPHLIAWRKAKGGWSGDERM